MNGTGSQAASLPAWLLKILGADPERLQGGTEHFRLARFPEGAQGLLVLVLIGCAFVAVAAIYRREGALSTPRKLCLAALRCALVAAAALVLLYPVLEVDRSREVRATTILLADDSLSQGIRDRYLGEPARRDALAASLGMKPEEVAAATRAELASRALADPAARVLERLEEKNHVVGYSFSDLPLRPLEIERSPPPAPGTPAAPATTAAAPAAGPPKPAVQPRGAVTDIGGALRLAVEEQGEARIAAIVLVTDGRATAGEDLAGAGAFLAERGIPVHAAGAGDPTPSRNLRVAAVLASERIFTGDPVVVDVRLEAAGFAGETVELELLDAREAAGEAAAEAVRVETARLTLGEAEADGGAGAGVARSEVVHSFRFQPQGVGRHRLIARLEQRAEESLAEDNEGEATVEVVAEASKVLLIAGGPSYEYRFLKNLLRRDARVSLAAWLMSADPDYPQEGDVSIKELPAAARDLFAYDVVILLDPAPRGLPAGFPALLEDFVARHRGGLLFAAGDLHGADFFSSDDTLPVRGLLPVRVDPAAAKDDSGPGRFYEREWPLEPTAAALDHAATRLSSQIDRNRQLWGEIAGFFWSFPAQAAKAGATVLFVHPDPSVARDGEPRPLVASQFYGGGRVLWCGIDSTWRWRATAEEVYDRFWIQSIRYLTEGRIGGERRRLLQTDRESYELGDAVRLALRLQDENYQPVEREGVSLRVEGPDGVPQDVALEKDPAAPGWYRGVHVPRLLGVHRARLEEGDERRFTVTPPALEFQDPRLDEAALRALAARTGGSYEPLANLSAIPDRIPDRRHTVVTTDEPIPLWDNALGLSVLVGLLTLEWVLRKLNRLL